MSRGIQASHFIDHDEVVARLAVYSNSQLYVQALNELFPQTLDYMDSVIKRLGLEAQPVQEAGTVLIKALEEAVTEHVRRAGHVDAFLFMLVGSELLWRAHKADELKYWTVSSHLNALNCFANIASRSYGSSVGSDNLAALVEAYSLAERISFIQHNLQVYEISEQSLPLSELIRRPFEPEDLEEHWNNIAKYDAAFVEYEPRSRYAEAIEKELDRRRTAPLANLDALLIDALSFGIGPISTLLQVFADDTSKQALVLPIPAEFFKSDTFWSKPGLESALRQFAWSPGDKAAWDLSFRPILILSVGGEETLFAGPSLTNTALTSFFNVVSQNAFVAKYLPAPQVQEFMRKNARLQQVSSTSLCYKVADVFSAAGLRVPISGRIPSIELKSISIGGERLKVGNHQDIGDIDVLAGDDECREILICECKLFRSGLTPDEFVKIDMHKARKAIDKVRLRQRWAEDNAGLLARLLGLGDDPVRVRSVIVTARPSFMASRFSDDRISFLDFGGLVRRYPPVDAMPPGSRPPPTS